MKKLYLLLLALFFIQNIHAQLNIELVSHLPYDDRVNDVWGHESPDGTEYAMVGLRHGISFVSLADAENPVEVFHIPGEASGWRDLRTFGQYAYVVADEPGTREGLWAMDMSLLPDSVILKKILYEFPNDTLGTDTLFTCHNVWVDEKGYAYLTGCDVNSGGVLIYDLNNDPMQPEFVGMGAPIYSHDNYVRNDLLYTSEINEGRFGVYDVSDRSNPQLLGVQETPYNFTHNVWLSDDGNTLFTTDEKGNAPVGAYDVSDPSDIFKLDEFRPAATLGTGVIPHNVHVLDDFLIISHYTDGCVIVDANEPDNLVEVGNYDTSTGFTDGFHGAWGAYPYFSSGFIAVSDIENGLFILNPTYQRASYLEGKVSNVNTGIGIPNATVSIQATTPTFETTSLSGKYKTGLATAGTFNVIFKAVGYFDQTVLATVMAGEITVLDVEMVPLPAHELTGKVLDESNGNGIPDAVVFIENANFSYETTTNANGEYNLPGVLQGAYDIYIGKWGYENLALLNQPVETSSNWEFELPLGYADNFNTDLGWQVSGDATNGIWERGVPNGTSHTFPDGSVTFYNPFSDSPWDLGGRSYVTGNLANTDLFGDQVDNGTTILTSPPMELASRYMEPTLKYDYWWFTVASNNAPDDTLRVWITNGTDTALLEEYDAERHGQEWRSAPAFDLADFIEINDNVRLFVTISDSASTPNVTEAGLDNFLIWDAALGSPTNEANELIEVQVFPNPFGQQTLVKYDATDFSGEIKIVVTNTLGQPIETFTTKDQQGEVRFGDNFPSGTYFIHFLMDGQVAGVKKVVKI